jgi:pimeloyl-ACP methyl ester carboxylesterase
MQAGIEERYGVLWEDLEFSRLAPRLHAPALVIHDRTDRVVPWRQGVRVARLWSGARLLATDGLGHGRILEDEKVSAAAADFIAGRSAVAPIAYPSVSVPAPLY